MTKKGKSAFTLAEGLITLGVIGVVVAVTIPTLVTNSQERVRKEQVRTVKYKFTKATEKMNSLGKIGHYDSTMDFVNELKKHLTIAKICNNTELEKCWASEKINGYQNNSTTLSEISVSSLQTGSDLKALALSTKNTQTVGIVIGDGVPMILVYSPKCQALDEVKTYTWSVEDGKPVTNATTNCISAIFDINGSKGPNRVGQDIRTLNSLFGSVDLRRGYAPVGIDICNKMKQKYGLKYCTLDNDAWVGAIYACDNLNLHLPGLQTISAIASEKFDVSDYSAYAFFSEQEACEEIAKSYGAGYLISKPIICNITLNYNANNSITGDYWTNVEFSDKLSLERALWTQISVLFKADRTNSQYSTLCVGD